MNEIERIRIRQEHLQDKLDLMAVFLKKLDKLRNSCIIYENPSGSVGIATLEEWENISGCKKIRELE